MLCHCLIKLEPAKYLSKIVAPKIRKYLNLVWCKFPAPCFFPFPLSPNKQDNSVMFDLVIMYLFLFIYNKLPHKLILKKKSLKGKKNKGKNGGGSHNRATELQF